LSEESANRERVLSYAEERFMREGFARVSVDDLTEGLAMSKKTFYRVFRSKEDLIEQIVLGILAEIRQHVETITRGKGSFVEKIDAMMGVFTSVYRRIESPLIGDLQRHLPAIWGKIETFRREGIQENFTRLLVQGIQEGAIRPTTNVRLLVLSLVGAIQSVIRPTVLVDESFSAREAVEGILQIVLHGVMTGKGMENLQLIREKHRPQQS